MRIGVISDTHGHEDLTRPAVRMLESLEVEAVLHCGDIGSTGVVQLLSGFTTHYVFGNCDFNQAELAKAMETTGGVCHGDYGELTLAGVRIALLHSHQRARFRQAIDSGDYQLICYGHTHVAAIDWHGDEPPNQTLVLNPGAIYRANPHSIAVIELPQREATIVELV